MMTPSPLSARLFLAVFGTTVGVAGCQVVTEFDEDLICEASDGQPIDCNNPELVPDAVRERSGIDLECVTPTCDPRSGECQYPPNENAVGEPCQAANRCLTNTTCNDQGECVGDALPDGTDCTVNACDFGTCQGGVCDNTQLEEGDSCDDGNACTRNETCRRSGDILECAGEEDPSQSGMSCDDGDPCTVDEVCFNGACRGTDVECPDGDICDPESGDCVAEEMP
jgi:hypothetical protein